MMPPRRLVPCAYLHVLIVTSQMAGRVLLAGRSWATPNQSHMFESHRMATSTASVRIWPELCQTRGAWASSSRHAEKVASQAPCRAFNGLAENLSQTTREKLAADANSGPFAIAFGAGHLSAMPTVALCPIGSTPRASVLSFRVPASAIQDRASFAHRKVSQTWMPSSRMQSQSAPTWHRPGPASRSKSLSPSQIATDGEDARAMPPVRTSDASNGSSGSQALRTSAFLTLLLIYAYVLAAMRASTSGTSITSTGVPKGVCSALCPGPFGGAEGGGSDNTVSAGDLLGISPLSFTPCSILYMSWGQHWLSMGGQDIVINSRCGSERAHPEPSRAPRATSSSASCCVRATSLASEAAISISSSWRSCPRFSVVAILLLAQCFDANLGYPGEGPAKHGIGTPERSDSRREPRSTPRRIWTNGGAAVAGPGSVAASGAASSTLPPPLPSFGQASAERYTGVAQTQESVLASQESFQASQGSEFTLAGSQEATGLSQGLQRLAMAPEAAFTSAVEQAMHAQPEAGPFSGLSEALSHAATLEASPVATVNTEQASAATMDAEEEAATEGPPELRRRVDDTLHSASGVRSAPRAAPATAVPSAETPGPFASGSCPCPWCPGASFSTPAGFMRHVTHTHEGTCIDAAMLIVLQGMDRAVCTGPGCGCIRRIGTRQCHRCSESRSLRPLSEGDVVPGGRGVPLRSQPLPSPQAVPMEQAQHTVQGDIILPDSFIERIRRIPQDSQHHIPSPCRVRFAVVSTLCWEGMAAGLPGWSALEEARSRLLLSAMPEGAHVPKEVATRLALFERRAFGELLNRVELQLAMRRQRAPRKRRRGGAPADATGNVDARKREQALKQTAEGAYRKAINTASYQAGSFSDAECRRHATALHPPAADPNAALAATHLAEQPAENQDPEDEEHRHPLSGVRFGALKAPGPSGTRPEHISEILGVQRKRIARKALRALAKLVKVMQAGELHESARWITRTRTIFLPKKNSDVPRTVKIGETLRMIGAKQKLNDSAPSLRPTLGRMRQWGISFPGSAESLIHWRSTVEEAAHAGVIDPVVVADLDMKNFFNTVEWEEIRASMRQHFPEALPIVEWEQQRQGTTILPDGSEFHFDRGAEQGEPLGAVKAVLPLGDSRCRIAATNVASRTCDEWYIDDGQLVCAPAALDPWLRAFDSEIARIGATRGSGTEVKSTVRLICPEGREAEFEGWATQYVRSTCKVLSNNAPAVALGATIGSTADVKESFGKVCDKVLRKREAISSLGSSAAELVLTRRCADVGNVNYWLRCYGDVLRHEPASRFDKDLRAAVEESLCGKLSDTAWWQGGIGVAKGGLGLRSAQDMALPAFVSSRVASRPMVAHMLTHIEAAGLGIASEILKIYDARTNSAARELASTLPEAMASEVREAAEAEAVFAAKRWDVLLHGRRPQSANDTELEEGQTSTRQIGSLAPGLVADAGAEDSEHPDFLGGPSGPPLQRTLCRIVDNCVHEGLRQHFLQAEALYDVQRVQDLAAEGNAHGWLWALAPQQSAIIEEDAEFVEAVRVRLGDGGPPDVGLCGYCGKSQLDTSGAHASCCAIGEATVGHNAVRDVLFEFASTADPATEWEPEDLISSRPRARPADVLTPAAIAGRVAALDVGITSPATSLCGDAAEDMFQRKTGEREDARAELEAQNIVYRPMIWTGFGRPHVAAEAVLKAIARRVARRRGRTTVKAVLRQMRLAISVCLARRAARMSLACWPRQLLRDGGSLSAEVSATHFEAEIQSPARSGAEMWF